MKLSIIIPAYNEATTMAQVLAQALSQTLAAGMTREVIVVDDGSTDGTDQAIMAWRDRVRVCTHVTNRGKGASVRTGLAEASGDIILIQDADLEYDPSDWSTVLAPLVQGDADVVFGSRFSGSAHRVLYFWHYAGNKFLTFWSNMFTNLNLTDMETGTKAFTRAVADTLRISSDRFGFEPEFTARVAHGEWRIFEVGVSYRGRSYREGKKITWRDGIAACWHILRWNGVCLWDKMRASPRKDIPASHSRAVSVSRPFPPSAPLGATLIRGVALFVLILGLLGGLVPVSGDGRGYYFLYRQMREGNWSLKVDGAVDPANRTTMAVPAQGGQSTYFQIGVPFAWLITLPAVGAIIPPAFGERLGGITGMPQAMLRDGLAILLVSGIASYLLVAGAARLLMRELGVRATVAWASALVAFVGLPTWHYAFQFPSYAHTLQAAVLMGALLLFFSGVRKCSLGMLACAGAVTGFAALMRIDALLYLVVFGVTAAYVFPSRRAVAAAACVLPGVFVAAIQFLIWSQVFGSLLPTSGYMLSNFTGFGVHAWDVLFSNWRGFFVWSPVAFIAFVGLCAAVRVARFRLLAVMGLATLLLYALLYGSWDVWWGGSAVGQRFLIPLYPSIAVGIAAGWHALRLSARSMRAAAAGIMTLCVIFNVLQIVWLHPLFGIENKERYPLSSNIQYAYEQSGFPLPRSWEFVWMYTYWFGPRLIHYFYPGTVWN